MKYYDKEIYEMEEKIKVAVLTLLIFIISFLLGVFIGNLDTTYKDHQTIKQLQIEIEHLKNK